MPPHKRGLQMGLDLLDIIFRAERVFGIRLKERDVAALFTSRQPADATAGELYDLVRQRYLRRPIAHRRCIQCGYPRLGLPMDVRCPECGQPSLEDPAEMWKQIRQILSDSIGCDTESIRRESLVRKDLGATI
jgi:hypothetical protein